MGRGNGINTEERRKKVKELYEAGKLYKEIAQSLGASPSTIQKDINYLINKGKMGKRKERKGERSKITEERREKVRELYCDEEMSKKDIAQLLGVNPVTVIKDIKSLEEKLDTETIRKLCNTFCGQPRIKKIFKKCISDCKDKFEQGTIEEKEIETIRDIVIATDDYEDAVFYLKVLVRFRRVDEAIKFVNGQTNKENYTKEQKAKMENLKQQIQLIKRKYIAIRILKEGRSIEEAMYGSNLPEIEVLRLRRIFVQNTEIMKEENDKGEEQNI